MPNPYEMLGKKQIDWEDCEGDFGCQHCPTVVHEAKYYEAETLLTWKCPNGHVSKAKMKL